MVKCIFSNRYILFTFDTQIESHKCPHYSKNGINQSIGITNSANIYINSGYRLSTSKTN